GYLAGEVLKDKRALTAARKVGDKIVALVKPSD
ncbi:MAG: hypothetical protein H6R28_235, partial [Methanomicrobiales archaeon]|nr:hypothetical protein [Methanomicrobiales archaeon]